MESSAGHCICSSAVLASTLDPGFLLGKVGVAHLCCYSVGLLWDLHSEWHLAYSTWFARLCRSQGLPACVPGFSPPAGNLHGAHWPGPHQQRSFKAPLKPSIAPRGSTQLESMRRTRGPPAGRAAGVRHHTCLLVFSQGWAAGRKVHIPKYLSRG